MLTYIIRRILLMIPTLIGISFLIFMLVALSPGGVGAALRVAGGGATEATNRAVQEAYLEDRYGLDAPVFFQYLRWLGRISPVKFGERDQIAPTGEVISRPKPVKSPLAWQWFASELPAAPQPSVPWEADATQEQRQRQYQRAVDRYAQDRAAYIAARTLLRESIGAYFRAAGRPDLAGGRADPPEREVTRFAHQKDLPQWQEVETRGATMMQAYQRAVTSRAALEGIFEARIFPQAGTPIIPGLLSVAAPDLGMSFSRGRPVQDLISKALPVTIMINLIAFPIIYAVAIPSGIAAATRQGRWFDVTSGVAFVALWSVPTVWAGVLAIGFLASKDYLGWFPVTGLSSARASEMTFLPTMGDDGWQRGWLLDLLWHVCLPVLCLVYSGFAVLSKQTRAAMLDNFNADYVRTAKAKGVEERVIVFAHVFRNSLLPLITMFATIFPAMLAGSVVIERIFSIPGMGSLIIEAITLKDRELILANALMIATVNVLALLLADILYALADPRISYK